MIQNEPLSLNYYKICAYINCQIQYWSNRSTSKYCCPKHRCLQWHLNQKEKKDQIILDNKEADIRDNVSILENNLKDITKNNDTSFDLSFLDNPMLIKKREIPQELFDGYDRIIDDYLDYFDLLIGIGVHIQKDELGNELFYYGDIHFKEHNRLDFFNFSMQRWEVWTFNKEFQFIRCKYSYPDFTILKECESDMKRQKLKGILHEKKIIDEFNANFKSKRISI